jgi:hypothetical protein
MPGCSDVRSRPPVRFAIVCLAFLFSAVAVRGQGDDVLPTEGMDSLLALYKKHKELANDLLRGFRVANSREIAHVEALDVQAQYVTYQFTWFPVQNTAGEIGKIYERGIDTDVRFLTKGKPGTNAAIEIYAPKVTEHALKVLKTPRIIARVNAARVLARLADLGPPELADALVTVLQDPDQNDGVKFHIIHGLRTLGEMNLRAAAEQQPAVMSADRERKAADALAAFIQRNMNIVDTTRPEDVAGFRYVRREAIRALALYRNPAVAANGQAGIALLRVVAKDGLVPSPRLDERIEAAIGLARYRPLLDKEYNADYALTQIGLFLEEFNREYTASRGDQKIDNKLYAPFAWKVQSSRLCDAMDLMRVDVTDDDYVVKLNAACLKLLEKLEKNDPADPEEILRIIAGKRQSTARLYKNIPDSTVKPANRNEPPIEAPSAPAYLEANPPPRTPPAGDAKPGAPPASAPNKPAAPPAGAAPAAGNPAPGKAAGKQ